MFKWLTEIFKKKSTVSYDIGVKVIQTEAPRIKIKQENVPEPTINPKKQEPPKGINMNARDLQSIWLVVVDTTGLDKPTRSYNESNPDQGGEDGVVDARKLGQLGIKTFAFVNASDVNAAKGFFWRTLGASNPRVRPFLPVIARATKVTNFSQIFPILTRPGVVWNYVGGKNESMPGQQSNLAKQKELAGRDQYGNESAREYQHVPPQVPEADETTVNPSDLGNLSAEDKKIMQSGLKQPSMANMNNMNQQQMMQMMQMMMAMMQNNNQAPPPVQKMSNEPSKSIHELSAEDVAIIESNKTELNPEEADPELQRQIQEIKESGKKGFDLNIMDDEIDPAELEKMAKTTQSIVPRTPEQVAEKKKKRING